MHAVSVGEVLSSIGMLRELRARDPEMSLFVSTATLAGRAVAEDKLQGLVNGVFYAPLDYVFGLRRVLRAIRPSVGVVMETEIWPELYRQVKKAGCGLLVVNGRISDRALPKYQRLRGIFKHVLQWPDAILVQSTQDRNRYIAVGAPPEKVRVLGNLKYDADPAEVNPPPVIENFLERTRAHFVWIAASTMPGADSSDLDEDDAVIAAFQALASQEPELLLILVPRKPERFELAAAKLASAGIRWQRRSDLRDDSELSLPGVLLLDSIGELGSLFRFADAVFMGGTLVRRGGHNILEPAAAGKPIVIGPHMENFPAIASAFRSGGGVVEIPNAESLAGAVAHLRENPIRREEIGLRARNLALSQRGATERAVNEILELRDAVIPGVPGNWLLDPFLWLLSRLWIAGNRRNQRRGFAEARELKTPVVSVGGLSMGGSGKTPFVAWLAHCLAEQGIHPAILTRGYRRRSLEEPIAIAAGHRASVHTTGDEAQVFLRRGDADVGIGANRWRAGKAIEERFAPDLFLLDDGFQHWRLKRDLDIVLLDVLNPLGRGVFPLGRLREPVSALARADVFVLMRARPGREYRALRKFLRSWNDQAPILMARVRPSRWISLQTGQPEEIPSGRVGAFCGLGNPASFWRTLDDLNLDLIFRWTFDDHHRYEGEELRRIAARAKKYGADIILTTEKDAMNLPEQAVQALGATSLYWLEIEIEVLGKEALFDRIRSKLHRG